MRPRPRIRMAARPEGTDEKSPAFQRWVRGPKGIRPKGTAEASHPAATCG